MRYTVANHTHKKRHFVVFSGVRCLYIIHTTIASNGSVKNISTTAIIFASNPISTNGHNNHTPYVVHQSKKICDKIATSVISVQSFRDCLNHCDSSDDATSTVGVPFILVVCTVSVFGVGMICVCISFGFLISRQCKIFATTHHISGANIIANNNECVAVL